MKTKTLMNPQISTSKTQDIVISSILIALVFIATKFINIRLPISINGGLIHLGTGMLFISSIVFGKKKGAISGAIGITIFDVLSGWLAWAPFTFVVRWIMGYIVGHIAWSKDKEGNNLLYNIVAILISGIWMIVGYYITEGILYGNWISPVTSIPGNAIQIAAGGLVSLPLAYSLKRTKAF